MLTVYTELRITFVLSGLNMLNLFDILALFSFRTFTLGFVYIAGYLNIGSAWPLGLLFLSLIRDRWKIESKLKQYIAEQAQLRKNKESLQAIIGQLPPWVYYPELECCEWHNRIITQLWPNFSYYIIKIVEDTLEPKINETLTTYKGYGFKFQCLRLGSVSPRICGIKVYEINVSQDEIVIDMNLFYGGNCDLSFMLFGLSGGIQNLKMGGWLRLVIKPLLTSLPLIGGMEMYFLYQPKVEFNLVGAAAILNVPGLSGMMRKVIEDQIASMIVIPNKMNFSFTTAVNTCMGNMPKPEGVLRVNIIEAIDLVTLEPSRLFHRVKSDPYVTVTFGLETFKSEILRDSPRPNWDFWAEFIIDSLYDENIFIAIFKGDSCVGKISIEADLVKEKRVLDTWIQLEDIQSGVLHVCMLYFQLSSNLTDYTRLRNNPPLMASSLLLVYIDSAKNLCIPNSEHKPDTFVQLVVGNNTKTSRTVFYTDSPSFRQNFIFLVNDPKYDVLEVHLFDQKYKLELGQLYFNLKQVMNCRAMEILNQQYVLDGSTSKSTILLSIKLSILKNN